MRKDRREHRDPVNARHANLGADIRQGGFGNLPWPDGTFDVVMAVNTLQFADDMVGGLREAARKVRHGGRIGIANWAEARHNDIETIDASITATRQDAEGELSDDDYRHPGGLERLFEEAGVTLVDAGMVAADWHVPDEETLIRGVFSGLDLTRSDAREAAILHAARPFAVSRGYVLRNAFRFAVARSSPDPL